MRDRLSLDGGWRFVRDPERALDAASLPDGEAIVVPGCWEAQVPDPFGIVDAWYWRDLVIPETWPETGQLVAEFGAVMYRCDVWLDGHRVGSHEGGYTPFEVPLGDVRRDRPSRLAVRVTNPMNAITEYPALSDERLSAAESRVPDLPIREIPHGKQTWYASQSGLWRSVALERRPSSHLGRVRPVADPRTGIVRLNGELVEVPGGNVEVTVIGPNGVEVAASSYSAGSALRSATIAVARPVLWDLDDPNLYRLVARLIVDGERVDEISVRFGFREVRTEGGRILLNGRPILVRGALDQDLYDATISTPPSRATLDEQMRLAREMGLNLLRCHIKVPDPAYLDAADEAGMLVWCELPNWLRFTVESAARGERLLDEMVDAIGHHPSVVIWTIINEDWGTDLRHSARDRRWLRRMTARLRAKDPTRLVVDNSACATRAGPNFHIDTDLADFHRYAAMPDAAERWNEEIAELATRPAWLWSPHGDAVRHGDEPLVVSEFGTWALPDPARLDGAWWSASGDGPARPAAIHERFERQRLGRIWPDVAALCDATQRLRVEALRHQVGEIRRHSQMAGLVVTEFTDAHWEANGLLDLARRPKADHERLPEIFGPAMLVVDLDRSDLWGGERIRATVTLSSESAGDGGRLGWRLGTAAGSIAIGPWPAATAVPLAKTEITVPLVDAAEEIALEVWLEDARGVRLARASVPCAVLPSTPPGRTGRRRIAVEDELDLWAIRQRLATLGHEVATSGEADLVVTTRLTADLLEEAEAGSSVVVLARSKDAIANGMTLARPLRIAARWPDPGRTDADFTWTGDWISAFSWITPELAPGLPWRAPLDFVYREVLPDHVLLGYDPEVHAAEVEAGMFVGWIHAPAALMWSFEQGRGHITVSTLHLAPEDGPVATGLLDAVIELATSRSA